MRRSLAGLAGLVVTAGLLVGVTEDAGASSCAVENPRTDAAFASLQAAVDNAISGDTLEVVARCVGTTIISHKSVRIVGVATPGDGAPTLKGRRTHVLVVEEASVELRDLRITDGSACCDEGFDGYGAGVLQLGGRLILSGGTRVVGNHATYDGGGVFSLEGTVILRGSSSVARNHAGNYGAGIAVAGGRLTLNHSASVKANYGVGSGGIYGPGSIVVLHGSASVSDNMTDGGGGGVRLSGGEMRLNDSSSVTANRAWDGGGIYAFDSTIWLRGSASVTGNTAASDGGGIRSRRGLVYACSDLVVISPNDPDDPPPTHPCDLRTSVARRSPPDASTAPPTPLA